MEKKKILFVDDSLHMRLYILTILTANGYASISARNGKEGLVLAKDWKPDMILLDIVMPNEGGVLMYGRLKEDPVLKTIPVCILTGVGKASFLHYLKMTGINRPEPLQEPDAYLEKPFEPVDIVSIINRVLNA